MSEVLDRVTPYFFKGCPVQLSAIELSLLPALTRHGLSPLARYPIRSKSVKLRGVMRNLLESAMADRFLSIREVLLRTSLSKTHTYRLINARKSVLPRRERGGRALHLRPVHEGANRLLQRPAQGPPLITPKAAASRLCDKCRLGAPSGAPHKWRAESPAI